ncbi:LysR family transcriptional regulator [Ramlibacter sp. AW1]|uniref:LysR family transcriptional regulator n=1 Tax=Ramlibacter aurantiacus TaxID=2801330 RepID=A0A936ZWE7_9BURK|nr:LysR family transcriptional regulator [Ramlibacter aurantiacus]MBL0421784.1 LysR family transcriptional regulator [Ramlibacter aurantiacus]
MPQSIQQLDLNLLRLFEAVMREGGISRAGERLGLSQPAASKAVKRLRAYCGDPLFVRTAAGLKPTPMASAILPTVTSTLASLQGALDEYRSFVPAQSTRRFTFLIMDVGELILMPRLIAHLARVAPNLRIVCRQTDRNRYASELASGAADIAFGELPMGQPDLVQQFLFDEDMVCVVGQHHPTIRRSLSRAQFLATPQVANSELLWETRMQAAMGADFHQRRVAMELKHFLVMPLVVASGPQLAVVPRSVAETYRRALKLKVFAVPYDVEPVHVRHFWHRRSQHDVGHGWLRGEIARMYRRKGDQGEAA